MDPSGEPYASFARLLQAAYVDAKVSPAVGFNCKPIWRSNPSQAGFMPGLPPALPSGGDRPLLVTIETSSQQRVEALVWRSRAFAWLELALMIVGILVLMAWLRRGRGHHVSRGLGRAASLMGRPSWRGRSAAWGCRRGTPDRGISVCRE